METKLKQKLLNTGPFEAIEKIMGNSQKVIEQLFRRTSSMDTSFTSHETSQAGGTRLFRYVKVNYPYLRRIQPKLY